MQGRASLGQGASFIEDAAHKKTAETGMERVYAFFTANVGIYRKILYGERCAFLRILSCLDLDTFFSYTGISET